MILQKHLKFRKPHLKRKGQEHRLWWSLRHGTRGSLIRAFGLRVVAANVVGVVAVAVAVAAAVVAAAAAVAVAVVAVAVAVAAVAVAVVAIAVVVRYSG